MQKGDYVRCLFPFRESMGPGPSSHIVLVTASITVGTTAALVVFYTTSQTSYVGVKRPRHLIHVDERKALSLGQGKAFDIDASRLALLPVSHAYFPEFDGQTLPHHGQDPNVASVVERRVAELKASGHRIDAVRLVPPAPGRGR